MQTQLFTGSFPKDGQIEITCSDTGYTCPTCGKRFKKVRILFFFVYNTMFIQTALNNRIYILVLGATCDTTYENPRKQTVGM